MSTPAQVTDAHRQLAKSIGCDPASEYCPQNVDADAQLIADSEARAVEAADFATQQERNIHMTTIAERDQLRAEVKWLKESDQKNQMICLDVMRERDEQRVRAERAEAELASEREKCRVLRDACERLRDCDWVITLPDRMDAVRDIARAALAATEDKP